MNGKKWYIAVFVISVLGLAFTQYQYLRIGLNLAKVQFNQKVGNAVEDMKPGLRGQNELTFLMAAAIKRDSTYFKLSADSLQSASRYFLNQYVSEKLLKQGIKTDFAYRLFDGKNDYLKSVNYLNFDDGAERYNFQLEGYLPKLLKRNLLLEIRFSNVNSYFLSQLNGLTIPSLIFLVAIIAVVVWVLRSFYWQKSVITTTNEFINNLTHELKTPVFSIGLATKLLEEKVPDESKAILAIIKAQNERLKTQIDTVLQLSALENKKRVINLQPRDVVALVKKVCAEFNALASLEGFSFSEEIKADSFLAKVDALHLENALFNLLDNAKKYGGNPSKIGLKLFTDEKFANIQVSDNGKGLNEDEMDKVFLKYYRGKTGDLHEVKGYGLGLSYVKRIVDLHLGKVEAKNKAGGGAVFTIKLKKYDKAENGR